MFRFRQRWYLLALLLVGLLIPIGLVPLPAVADNHTADGLGELTIRNVDTADFPLVSVDLGLTTRDKTRNFRVLENGKLVKGLRVESEGTKEPVGVTLIFDVSGSMVGEPLEQAKTAAKQFIEQMRPGDQIAVVAFADTVRRLADFTEDKAALNEAVGSLEASGETAVNDAIIESLNASKEQKLANQTLILLSDGGDTVSQASDKAVVDLAGRLGIPVAVIALESPEFDPEHLKEVADGSGGQLITAPSGEVLIELYSGLAHELHNRYQLVFTSAARKKAVDLEVQADIDGRVMTASTRLSDLPVELSKAVKPEVKSEPRSTWVSSFAGGLYDSIFPLLAAFVMAVAVFLGVFALGDLLRPPDNTLAEQLKYYDQLRSQHKDPDRPLLRRVQDRLVALAEWASIRYQFYEYAVKKLDQAGLPVRPNEYIVAHIGLVLVVGLLSRLIFSNVIVVLLAIGVAVVIPLLVIEMLVGRRKEKFNEQLADTLDMLAGSLRAGYGLQQALAAAAKETEEPTAAELKRVAKQVQMGMTLNEALHRLNERIGSEAFSSVVLATSIHRETGGNLAEIFDSLAASLRQRERMTQQIKGLTAEGRLSAIILLVMPFAEGLLMYILNPQYMSALTTTTTGLAMMGLGLIMMALGALWLRSIVNIDY